MSSTGNPKLLIYTRLCSALSSTESYSHALTACLGKNAQRLGRGKKVKRPHFLFHCCLLIGVSAEERGSPAFCNPVLD